MEGSGRMVHGVGQSSFLVSSSSSVNFHSRSCIWLTLPTIIIFSRFLLSLHDSNGESYGEEQLVFLKQRAAHVGVDTVGEMIIQTFYPFFQV